jgi:gamma-glutamylcyclotransferase (GGCT)/AIG2-like uncharacterized protein YtfP
MNPPRYLFVYGTLRPCSGHPMARLLAERARHVGAARAAGRLYNLGRFPGVLEAANEKDWVLGDVYELPAEPSLLEELDRYENGESPLPAFFDRQATEAVLATGETLPVWIYWYRGRIREEQRIISGDYADSLGDGGSR